VSACVVHAAISALVDGAARQGQIRLATRTLRWIEAGSGEPVIVAGAGLGEPCLAWAGVLRELAALTRVVAYDRAGLGESDPVAELSLDQELDDLVMVAGAAGPRPCVLLGHSWGGLLALLAALVNPHTVCGLVLVDSADERFWQSVPAEAHRQQEEHCRALIEQHASGRLAARIRDEYGPFARTLTADPATQELFLDAYVSCYATAPQAAIVVDEFRMALASIRQISAIRTAYPPPDVPMIVLSATTGQPAPQRRAWTNEHAALAASAPRGTHIILPDTGHAINEERPKEVVEAVAGVVRRARAERQDAPPRKS
jgi:pimeloyl-ACP methyl ester carboxylesterase